MNGNFGRNYFGTEYNHQYKFYPQHSYQNHQGNGIFLYGVGYSQDFRRHFLNGIHHPTRSYSMGNSNGYQRNHFINSIRNIFTGFLNPCGNYQYSQPYYRKQNQNRYRTNKKPSPSPLTTKTKSKSPIKTVIIDLSLNTSNNSTSQNSKIKKDNENNNNSTMDPGFITVLTSEDFPELPPPKKPYCQSSNCNSKVQCCTNSKKEIQQENSNETIAEEETHEKLRRQSSECESEDSFIVFSEECPSNSNYLQTCPTRHRNLSESSDDSFVICFTEDAAEGVIEMSDLSLSESESDNDEDDNVNHGVRVKKENYEQNNCDKKNKDNVETDRTFFKTSMETENQPDSGFEDREKKVRFNLKPEIHVMHAWDYAYRAARKGQWEGYARDRSRFKHRIDSLQEIIDPILNEKHREQVYRTRFCDNIVIKN